MGEEDYLLPQEPVLLVKRRLQQSEQEWRRLKPPFPRNISEYFLVKTVQS
ncbi:hypothetical protein ACU8KH_02617 [Lachancea thermotolerans]